MSNLNIRVAYRPKFNLTELIKHDSGMKKKARIETPIEFQGMHYNAIVHIKGIYIQENSWGLFANILDCQVFTTNVNCPF